jgi:hypothetical protein
MSLLNEASFLVTPNGYKEDKLYAAIPTNGNGDMTVTRASTATRVNEAGLIELVPYNLLLRSQEFNNASFAKGRSQDIGTDSTIAPNGTLTADTWAGDGDPGTHFLTQTASATSGVAYTQSVFAKKGTNNFIQILGTAVIYDSHSWANFDLESGILGEKGDSATATITDFGNGWYRCTMTATATATASGAGFGLRLITSAASGRSESNSLETSVYLWGAQLVEGTSAKTYQKTVDGEDIPRIDYTGGGCPSILLEPERTNFFTYSEQFDNDDWTKTNCTITANDTTAPDGYTSADRVTVTALAQLLPQSPTLTSGQPFVFSVFVKEGNWGIIRIGNVSSASSGAWFNVTNGTAGTINGGTSEIIDYGNGWYRLIAKFTSFSTGISFIGLSNADGSTTTSAIGTFMYVWGAQLEAGAYPTSYIPTTIESLTRIADGMIVDNIRTNNLITDAGGTWFVHLINNVVTTRQSSDLGLFIADSSDGTTGNGINIRNNSGLTPKRLTINKSIADEQSQLYVTTTDHVKVAIKWNGTTADVFENGIKVVSATSFTTTDMEFFSGTGADVSKYIKQMALFPTPLHDDECIALTTL